MGLVVQLAWWPDTERCSNRDSKTNLKMDGEYVVVIGI